jgi:lipopolysaccharide transport system ATP-binding protein
MTDTVIRVENLSKQYMIGAAQPRYHTLRDQIADGLSSLIRRSGMHVSKENSIWALKKISFEVKQGDIIGLIGRNGAGKSTLLKILSRITQPTTGMASIYGRLASLLEVGTGFHSELTGRENVYLNGAILGMRKAEIERNFDAIVTFAGVEKFIDTPVKHYSSGMYVRLGFAVAAHLEPEILVIDEVLAVGDLEFQNKCLGKMGEVARQGRTVLFVSHNMGAISNLCSSAIWLERGKLIQCGDVASVVRAYVASSTEICGSETRRWSHLGTGEARIVSAKMLDIDGQECTTFSMGDTLAIEFDIEFCRSLPSAFVSLEIKRLDMGIHILHLESQDCGFSLQDISARRRRFRVEIPNCLLYPTSYQVILCVWSPGATYDYVSDLLNFSMVQSSVTKRTLPLSMHRQAIFYQPSHWCEI